MTAIATVYTEVLPETSKIADGIKRAFREADPAAAEAGRRWGGEIERNIGDVKVNLVADTAKARAEIDAAARDRKAEINLDVDSNVIGRVEREVTQLGETAATAGEKGAGGLSQMGSALSGLGQIVGPIAITGMAAGLVELAGVAASAAQSLIILPAAIGGVAAAVGTLKIATDGFGQAMKDLRDPKKFAEDLQSLAPNAQQAALAIQALLPAFDQLKAATQNALFAGVGQQINQLANQYMPAIQQMTTGIAGAFNQMFQGVTNQLMTPETQAAMQTFMSNVTQAFQQLAPAMAPLTKAFSDLMAVGSGFLPQLAQAATAAAQSFSNFISQAAQSGQLQRWLSEGLNTLQQLVPIAMSLGQAFMSLAPIGQQILPQISGMLSNINAIMPEIKAVVLVIGPSFGLWQVALAQVHSLVTMVSGAFDNIKGVVAGVGNAIEGMANTALGVLNRMLQPIRDLINLANMLPGVNLPNLPELSVGSPSAPAAAPASLPTPAAGQPAAGGLPGAQRERRGATPALPPANIAPVPAAGYPVPLPTPPAAAAAPAAASVPNVTSSSLGPLTTPAGIAAGGSRVQALYALANSLQGTPYSTPLRNDCSGMVAELAAAAVGLPIPSAAQRFSTPNEGDWLFSHGFQPGLGGPNDFNIGWNPAPGMAGHTAATLPGGINAEQGGSNNKFTLGPGAAGANSKQFTMHAHLPMSADTASNSGVTPNNPMYVAYAPEQYQQYKPTQQNQAGQFGQTIGSDLMSSILPDGFKNPFQFGAWKLFSGFFNGLMGLQLPQGSVQGGDGASLPGGGGGGLGGLLSGVLGISAQPFGPLQSGSPGNAPGEFMPAMPTAADAAVSPFGVVGQPGAAGPGNQVIDNKIVIQNPVGQDHLNNMMSTAQQAQVPRVRQGIRPLPQ